MSDVGVELLARDARLHTAVEIFRVDLEHLGHARQVEADTAIKRLEMPLERGTGAIGNDRNARLIAEFQDARDLFIALGEHHDVRQPGILHALAVAMVLAHRLRGDRAVAVGGAQ